MSRVGIIGAGIGGLTLAHQLVKGNLEPVILEATDQPGGVITSSSQNGLVLEHGPQRMRLVEPVAELIDELALGDEVIVGEPGLPIYIYRENSFHPVPTTIPRFVRTDLLSWPGKLRILAEPLIKSEPEEKTVAEYLSEKFGQEAYENVIAPVFGGLYGSDPATMPARYALKPLFKLEERTGGLLRTVLGRVVRNSPAPPISFEDGLQRLPEALAARHDGRIRYECQVTDITQQSTGFQLQTVEDHKSVDQVVLTVPAHQASSLLGTLKPDSATRLSQLTYNSFAIVHLTGSIDRDGLGCQVHQSANRRILGMTWNGSIFDRDDLITVFLGGYSDPEIVDREPSEIGSIAKAEVADMLEIDPTVINVTRLPNAIPAYDSSWTSLEKLSMPEGIHLLTNYTGRVGITGRLREAKSLAASLN